MNGRHFEIADDADKLFNLPQFDSFHWGQYPLFTKLIVVWYLMVTNKNITISPSRSELQEPYAGLSLPIVEASRSQSDTTLGTTPLDEWSDRRRDLYLTTHNTHTRQTSMPHAGFERAIPTTEQPQTHTVPRAATGIRHIKVYRM